MEWVLGVGCTVGLLFALFLVWGVLHLRQSERRARAEIRTIELAEIEPLARECVQVFRDKLGITLDLTDWAGAARKLDAAYENKDRLQGAFARDDFYWYFVKPVGACLGELLCRHGKYQWVKEPGMDPKVDWANAGEAYPFDKAIKQAVMGDPGDLAAYVEVALRIDDLAAE
jgi:hypothetical protein